MRTTGEAFAESHQAARGGRIRYLHSGQFEAVGQFADGVVIGSAIVEIIERNRGKRSGELWHNS